MKCEKCNSKIKFKGQYILGEGYPMLIGDSNDFAGLANRGKHCSTVLKLQAPRELGLENTPKYRLILKRVS